MTGREYLEQKTELDHDATNSIRWDIYFQCEKNGEPIIVKSHPDQHVLVLEDPEVTVKYVAAFGDLDHELMIAGPSVRMNKDSQYVIYSPSYDAPEPWHGMIHGWREYVSELVDEILDGSVTTESLDFDEMLLAWNRTIDVFFTECADEWYRNDYGNYFDAHFELWNILSEDANNIYELEEPQDWMISELVEELSDRCAWNHSRVKWYQQKEKECEAVYEVWNEWAFGSEEEANVSK